MLPRSAPRAPKWPAGRRGAHGSTTSGQTCPPGWPSDPRWVCILQLPGFSPPRCWRCTDEARAPHSVDLCGEPGPALEGPGIGGEKRNETLFALEKKNKIIPVRQKTDNTSRYKRKIRLICKKNKNFYLSTTSSIKDLLYSAISADSKNPIQQQANNRNCLEKKNSEANYSLLISGSFIQ